MEAGSLSPGRYVGTAENDEAETPFFDELSRPRFEASDITEQCHDLEKQMQSGLERILGGEE